MESGTRRQNQQYCADGQMVVEDTLLKSSVLKVSQLYRSTRPISLDGTGCMR
eukprot:m.354657 g.354657  ORF g.354657 m.354657 type:complete len:52 (-) comp17071_c0_seq1:1334-1489(-)